MVCAVMGLAQGGEVAGVGPAAVFPVDQVVNLQAPGGPAAGDDTTPVPAQDEASQPPGDHPRSASDVHWAAIAKPDADQVGVAQDLAAECIWKGLGGSFGVEVTKFVVVVHQGAVGRLPACGVGVGVIEGVECMIVATDPTVRGAPTGHTVPVREVRLSAGAGFIVAICGEIMTMPGLPKVPSAEVIRLNDAGQVEGLF